ncbi:MAG: gliding motility-associated C-terminal domain-containing protein [Bacteroidia bacterium]|nr:gliding motility-associated C-terminal domain-containing protein [Bacteroidia bacterium]
MIRIGFYISLFCFLINQSYAQLNVNAGPDITVCINTSVTIGGTPSAFGGTPPYKYLWQPSTFLDSITAANPTAFNITSDITYTLTVIDLDSTIVSNTMYINLDKIFAFNAGIDTGFCYGQEAGVKIGAPYNNNAWHNFNWTPATGLNSSTLPTPLASPSVTTVYTLTVSDGLCPDNISQVTVSAFLPPYVDASADTTIDEGQTITLYGIGATTFWWQPDYNIKYRGTSNADVWPISSTTYTLTTQDQHGCYANDIVTVNVRSGELLFFYSAFTPNNDGDNDFFYIGNLNKYPENNLKIYNRYGKLIYNISNYDNSWDGTYLGNAVPTGTYFYIFNDGKDKLYKGSVSILR